MSFIRTWGTTAAERTGSYPCDALLADPDVVLHRGISVHAPAPLVFRWLCQLRVAPYSYDWIDNFGRSSPPVRDPALERLAVGQPVMRIFSLATFRRNHHLTIILDDPLWQRLFGRIAATYRLAPTPLGCRLTVCLIGSYPPKPFRWLAPLLPPGDLVMMRKQLLNIKHLAERDHAGDQALS